LHKLLRPSYWRNDDLWRVLILYGDGFVHHSKGIVAHPIHVKRFTDMMPARDYSGAIRSTGNLYQETPLWRSTHPLNVSLSSASLYTSPTSAMPSSYGRLWHRA